MSLYSSAVKRPVTTALVFVAIVIIGLFSLSRLSLDLYPKIDMNTIMVITSYSGAGAEDIENSISRPIENNLNSVSNLKHIRSNSRDNFSIVYMEFESGTDMDVATNDIRDKLDMVSNALPNDANNPIILKFSSDDMPILMISVTAEESAKGLNRIIEDNIVNRIARVDGVGAVQQMGAPIREINVYCNPTKLEAFNLTVDQITQAIQLANRNIPVGTLDLGSYTSAIRIQGEFEDTSEISDIIVGSYLGKNVYLRDVAEVHDGDKERMQESYTNNISGGVVRITKQVGANSVNTVQKIRDLLPEIQESLPSDVKMDVIMDTSENIVNTINSLVETIVIIFIVVLLVVLFFLGRWRATFIIILTIPISLIASFIYLFATGNTLNVISLSALSIAIGMVVDDAIVLLENITTHIERGSYPKQAAVYATNEVALSVIASTLTMLAVFLPLTFVSGFTGIFFRELGWIVSIIMIVSTAAALSLTPMLSSQMLRRTQRNSKAYDAIFGRINSWLDKLDNFYAKTLDYAVRHRGLIIGSAAGIFVLSLFLFPLVKTEFMPKSDNGYFSGTIEFPQGYNMNIAKQYALEFSEEMRKKYDEDIEMINFSVGQADEDNATAAAFRGTGNNSISMNVNLKDYGVRKHTTQEVAQFFREELAKNSELESVSITTGNGVGSGGDVDLEIYGYDFDKTNAVTDEFVQKIENNPALAQLSISRKPSTPEYHIVLDDEKLALYGLSKTTAGTALSATINGSIASYFREDGNEYTIRVRYAPEFRNTISQIENIRVTTPSGAAVRLSDLGKIEERLAPPTIERKDRERYVSVSMTVAPGHAMSDLVEATQTIVRDMDLPDGVTYKLAGQFESQQESFADLFSLMVLIIILVFIVMAAEFESLSDPFVIMFSVPFALTGVLLGLVLTNTPMGLMALVGGIMLIGIVVKNGIVLIDYTILNRERGLSVIQAVVNAGRSRLRPVLMTTLTTVLGMVPLAISTSEGSEMWRSMAMVVAFGLTISTVITLVIVPTVYATFSGIEIKRKRKDLRRRKRRHAKDALRSAN